MTRAAGVSVLVIWFTGAALNAQAPHGGQTAPPQPGPNVNAVGGIADPKDPAALVKADLNLQRQNETVVAASTRNPDHILAAANDYRFVDFPQDQYYGGAQNFFTRLVARLFGKPGSRLPARAAAAVGAWTGLYRSCDRGRTWIGSAVPGSPLDFSEASQSSPLKRLTELAAVQGGHAETTDPVLVAGPGGRMHLVVLGFVRFPNGTVGESRMFYVSYTDRNNLEGGACFTYDFMREIDRGTAYAAPNSPAPFIDKPAVAVDKDGTLYAAYTVFADTVKSKVIVARSTDGGATWTRTIPLLNLGFLRNHGTTVTIDPLDGTVYVAWRMFYDNWPLMVISKSYDRGRTFLPATPISNFWPSRNLQQIIDQLKAARLQPFDQTSGDPDQAPAAAVRAFAFPSIVAGLVNGKSKLFAVWTERAEVDPASPAWGLPSANGSPRVMISMSSDGGWTWTARRALDAGPRTEPLVQSGVAASVSRPSGPQIQPVLSISGTNNAQLLVMYYEAREELDVPFASTFISGIERMMDVRAARIDPLTGKLLAPSVQVSQYPVEANSSPAAAPEIAPGYRVANRQNLTMYAGGTTAFIGDYAGLAPLQTFEYKSGRWNWSADPASSLAIWTDNRDVAFPLDAHGRPDINGAWANYQPLVPTDPLAPSTTDCSFVASRNSNPYFSEIGGVVAGAPQSFKPLTIQRAFATYVENRTAQDRFFRLTIEDNERQGIDGSFDQFDFGPAGDLRDVRIFANSSHHRTIWVQPRPQGPTASLAMLVQETVAPGGALKADGYRTRVVLNPDPNNDALTSVPPVAPQYAGNPAISADTSELHNPQISSPQISTFRVSAPQISSPQISTPQISTPQISTPQISTPQISTPQISSPQISTPQISTAPPDEQNGTDVTYTVRNEGTTWTTYDAMFNVPDAVQLIGSGNYQFQVLITRTSLVPAFAQTANGCTAAARQDVHVVANIPVPQISSPQISTISNPQISTPQISTPQIATFSLAPSGGAAVAPDGADPDSRSAIIPDQVQVTVRAIALKPRAEILASGGTLFDPATVEAKVTSASTNVVQGTVEAPGTQPSVVTRPDLIVATAAPVPPGLSVPAGAAITLAPVTIRNQGSEPVRAFEPGASVGYYLSIDSVITAQDMLLASDNALALAVGGEITLEARTVTVPVTIAPGQYYIGVLVDGPNVVTESDEGNNYVSAPITVTAAQLLSFVTQPSSATAGQAIVPAVQVAARDATGAALPGLPVTLTFSANPVGASLAAASATTNAFGVATFPSLAVSQGGSGFTLQASGGTQTSVTSRPFNVSGGGPVVCGEAAFTTSQAATHPVHADPQFVGVADFNGDGRLDVVTANVGSQDVSVLLADASGSFGQPTSYAVGESPAGLTIGDFNRDGHPDIAVAEANAPTVDVLLGTATGAFAAATSYQVGNYAGVLTTADVNEDGRLDLIIAAAQPADGSGRLTILQGNGSGGFGGPVAVPAGGSNSLPAAIATADLNSDGHVDVIVSNRGEDNVSVFIGNGKGAFAPRVTYTAGGGALAVGDFTSDGHPDVAVAQSNGTAINFLRGSAAGTLTPGAAVTLAAAARALVAADVDGDGQLDLAVTHAQGFSTFLGNGDGAFGSERTLDPNSEPRGLATADFNNDGKADFVVTNGAPADAVTFLTNSCVAGPRQLLVSNTNDAGLGSLRGALQLAQANAGFLDHVIFRIPGIGVHTIAPASALPTLTDPIGIDGTTQAGYAGMPLIELNGSSIGAFASGLTLTAGGSTVRGMVINGFSTAGIRLENGGGNLIQETFLGTDALGTTARPNRGPGIMIVNSSNNTVGGTIAGSRNLISGNRSVGLYVLGAASTGNSIVGNLIGTDITGTVAVGNEVGGVSIEGSANTIGGTSASARNVISGNTLNGIQINSGATGTVVQGNYIGLDTTGRNALGNATEGVLIHGADNVVGGTAPGAGNVISANHVGVMIATQGSAASGNRVEGNFIGTNAAGIAPIGNFEGVSIVDAPNNQIGGATPAHRNVISGNTDTGVMIAGAAAIGNALLENAIFANGGLGIDLGNDGVTPNDVNDSDEGPNRRQNFPVIALAGSSTTSALIRGSLNSTPLTTFTLRFYANSVCDPSGDGEGSVFVGTTTASTDIEGNVQFEATFAQPIPVNGAVTATAMDPEFNTSEFSACQVVESLDVPQGFTRLWLGGSPASPNAWSLPTNWVPAAVPGPSDDVYIQQSSSVPGLVFDSTIHSLKLAAGARVNSARTLTISGDLINDGFLDVAKVIMTGTSALTGHMRSLTIAAGANVRAGITGVWAEGTLTIDGRYDMGDISTTVESNFATEGAGVLVMSKPANLLTVKGTAAFRGASTNGLLTDGVLRLRGDFEQRAVSSAAAFSPSGNHVTHFPATSSVLFESADNGPGASHFHHVQLDGGASVTLNTQVVATGTLIAPVEATRSTLTGGGAPRQMVVSGLDVGSLILTDVLLRAVGGPFRRFDNVDLTNTASSGAMLTIDSDGLSSPFTMNKLVFGPTVGTTLRLSVIDRPANPLVTAINLVSALPDSCGGIAQTGDVVITWNGVTCLPPQASGFAPFTPPGTAAEPTTTNPRSGNGSLELVGERSNPAYINEPGTPFGTFGQLNALSLDWAIDPESQGQLPPDLALRVYPADDPRTFFLHWDTCSAVVVCAPHAKGVWQTTSLVGRLSIQADFNHDNVLPASPADIPADAPISGIQIRGNYSFGLPSFSYVDNVTIGFTGATAKVYNFELANPAASRHRPSVAWTPPAAIADGTALSARELNATATAAGTFSYEPQAGTILSPDVHDLLVRFAAADTAAFLPVSRVVPLTVTGQATVFDDDPLWFTYLPSSDSFAATTTANPRSGNASLELSKTTGQGSAYLHEFHGIDFGSVGELTTLSMDWFIDPASNSALPPQLALRVYEYGDPRTFFLYWDTCSDVTPCDPQPTGSWQSTNVIGKLRIQSADGNPVPAEIPTDAPITGIHIRTDFGFGGPWHGFADNLAIGFGGREPIVFNFERFGVLQP